MKQKGIFRRIYDENPIKFWVFDLPFVLILVGVIIYGLLQ